MSATSSPPRRPRCTACDLPLRTCVCALVTLVLNKVEVLVLQHPHEALEAKNSVRLLRLALANCRVVVGETFDPDELLSLLDGDVSGSVLLYPADTLNRIAAARIDGPSIRPRRLVVLDGTWRKSLRMLHANPLLQTLPRCTLAPSAPARYGALRKTRHLAQLSTLEATCAALADIETALRRYEPLLDAFDRFVADRVARSK